VGTGVAACVAAGVAVVTAGGPVDGVAADDPNDGAGDSDDVVAHAATRTMAGRMIAADRRTS
jgi:hypothetical protein